MIDFELEKKNYPEYTMYEKDKELEKEELWSTEVWLKNMMYYLKTEMFMFTGRL